MAVVQLSRAEVLGMHLMISSIFSCCATSELHLKDVFIGSSNVKHKEKELNFAALQTEHETLNKSGATFHLRELLSPLESRQCLITVTSFISVDVLGITLPIILRKLRPVFAKNKYKDYVWKWYGNIWTKNGSLKCDGTKFYVKSDRTHCAEIEAVAISSASKSWNCEVEINVILPIYRLSMRDEGVSRDRNGFYYPGALEYYTRAPLVAKTYIFVDLAISVNLFRDKHICPGVVYGQRSRRNMPIVASETELTGLLVVAIVSQPNRKTSFSLSSVYSITGCQKVDEISLNDVNTIYNPFPDQEPLQVFENPTMRRVKEPDDFASVLKACRNTGSRHLLTWRAATMDHKKHIFHVQAYLIQTILRNFSLKVTETSVCEGSVGNVAIRTVSSGKSFVNRNRFFSSPYPSTSVPFASFFYFNDTSGALRFATTITRGTSSLPYEELFNVFQPNVWVVSSVILLFSGFVLVRLLGSRISGGYSRQLLALVQCLLEKDPYPSSVCTVSYVKGIIAGIFAASFLLSNAYRSNNVYNMIVPRKVLLYETLDQLEATSFTIYKHLTSVDHVMKFSRRLKTLERKNGSTLKYRKDVKGDLNGDDYYLLWSKEVSIWLWSGIFYWVPDDEVSSKMSYIEKIAVLPEKLLEFCRSNFEKETRYPNVFKSTNGWVLEEKLNALALEGEEGVHLNELASKNRIAIMLPASTALKYRNLLRPSTREVYVGKEYYASGTIAFNISGSLDYRVIRRIWTLHESGIRGWLHKLFDFTNQLDAEPNEVVRAAEISGNILVIFIVLSVGLVFAFLVLLCEVTFGVSQPLTLLYTWWRRLYLRLLMFVKRLKVRGKVVLYCVCNAIKLQKNETWRKWKYWIKILSDIKTKSTY